LFFTNLDATEPYGEGVNKMKSSNKGKLRKIGINKAFNSIFGGKNK